MSGESIANQLTTSKNTGGGQSETSTCDCQVSIPGHLRKPLSHTVGFEQKTQTSLSLIFGPTVTTGKKCFCSFSVYTFHMLQWLLYQASLLVPMPWLYSVKLMISIKFEFKAFNPFAGTREKGESYV